jgi:hypothetical protein
LCIACFGLAYVSNIYIHFEHPENIGHEISFHETSIRQTKTGNALLPGLIPVRSSATSCGTVRSWMTLIFCDGLYKKHFGINPGNKVLHVTGNQESRIIHDLGTNTDMTLLNESLVTRNMEDFVTWVDSSKIKRNILRYREKLDDFDLL